LEIPWTVSFPAADPQSLYTLNLYLASGGPVQDDQGRPMLDPSRLAQVFEYLQQAQDPEPAPSWVTQTETFQGAWTAFLNEDAHMAVVWASQYFREKPPDTAAALIPTSSGVPYSLATGWVWAIASSESEKHELVSQLAEYLTEPAFLSKWASAAGLLPPHPSALLGWYSTTDQILARQLQQSARLVPSSDILSSLSSPLRMGTIQSIRIQGDPQALADEVVHLLQNP
jgi:ABC-type glycerol-3-phosphate transport system substrate-binding protein